MVVWWLNGAVARGFISCQRCLVRWLAFLSFFPMELAVVGIVNQTTLALCRVRGCQQTKVSETLVGPRIPLILLPN